ncbi:MAG: zinc ribbon domain-containing protein [Bacillota bacterium]|nr:zinc ribbon domain-containing protein [Bacillota bacterium]
MSVEHSEVEEREVSRAEKILAAGMVIFLLIGGFWVLGRIARWPARPDQIRIEAQYDQNHEISIEQLRNTAYAAQMQFNESWQILDARRTAQAKALQEYEFRREEYRVLLERGEVGPAQRATYENSRVAYEEANAALAAAEAAHAKARAAQDGAQTQFDVAMQEVDEAYRRADRAYELQLLMLRLLYVLPVLVGGIVVWQRTRAARSRYLIVATAFLAFGIIQAAVLAFQYSWHLFREAVQVIVSVTGTAAAIGGIVAVNRYAGDPRRVAAYRLRRGQCYACGFPGVAERGHQHCPACGAALLMACEYCGGRRPVRAEFCPSCGR